MSEFATGFGTLALLFFLVVMPPLALAIMLGMIVVGLVEHTRAKREAEEDSVEARRAD